MPALTGDYALWFSLGRYGMTRDGAEGSRMGRRVSRVHIRLSMFEEVGADMSDGITWNAGEMGCGELIIRLRSRLADLPADSILTLIAYDSGAQEDIPSWCRLTGHELLRADHPEYVIQRKKG